MIAYPDAERDYIELMDELFSTISPAKISFVSMGGLRMTAGLRAAARRRFPKDAMLLGEDVLAEDGRYRTFAPMRIRLYKILADKFKSAGAEIPSYLCMENSSVHERVFGAPPRTSGDGRRTAGDKMTRRITTNLQGGAVAPHAGSAPLTQRLSRAGLRARRQNRQPGGGASDRRFRFGHRRADGAERTGRRVSPREHFIYLGDTARLALRHQDQRSHHQVLAREHRISARQGHQDAGDRVQHFERGGARSHRGAKPRSPSSA